MIQLFVFGIALMLAFQTGKHYGSKEESDRSRLALEAAERIRALPPLMTSETGEDEITAAIMTAQNTRIRILEEQLEGMYGRQQAPSFERDRVSSPRRMRDL